MSGVSALLIGCGSIGKRHLRNLKALGAGPLYAFDPAPERVAQAVEQTGARGFADLAAALAMKPGLVIVASPNSLHLSHALAAARAGAHLFIEKPLSHSLDGVDELRRVVEREGLTALVGCNMRFHPGVALARRLVMEGAIGRVSAAEAVCVSYLPDWHPGEDYRKNYSARKDLGGGVILDAIHEIDYVLDMLGAPEEVSCRAGTFGDLGIETEDTADISLRLRGGARASIHLDYLSKVPRRGCSLTGTLGKLEWDWDRPAVRLYTEAAGTWTELPCPFPDENQMYVDELRHMLDCVAGKARPAQGLGEATLALRTALAAKDSAAREAPVAIAPAPRTVVVIQARMGSTRLPGKVLMPLGGQPLLLRMLERVRAARKVDEVVLATSDLPADDAVARAAAGAGLRVHRGSEEDVLDRFYQAARRYGATTIVRLTGDCPLADPALIDRMVGRFEQERAEYLVTGESFPDGFDVEVMSYRALESAWKEATLKSDREHVCPYIRSRPERFKGVTVEHERDLKRMRLTVDEEKDYAVVSKVFEALFRPGRHFTLAEAADWLDAHPETAALNSAIVRNEGYLRSLERDKQA